MPAAHATGTASGQVRSGPGELIAVLLTAGADLATIVVYDNTAGSGTVLAQLKAAANTSVVWAPAVPYAASKGIYVDVTGGTTPRWVAVYK